ncbi:MAG: cell division protein FtsZ, partial [Ktedonobacterales bacterium]
MNPGQTGGTAGESDAGQPVRGDVLHISAEAGARNGGVPSVPVVTPAPNATPTGIARLLAVGVGGAGSNAINHMIEAKVPGIEFLAMNTDAQALGVSRAAKRIRLGETLTRGLGAGGNPEVGRKAAEESYDAIREALTGSDMVFITAGMGGGTGTGAAPLVAQAAREQGALAIDVVTTPFAFERRRKYLAEQ